MLKRLIDIIGAVLALLMFSPLFAVVALLVKLTDGGSVLFWQIRVGKGGRHFFLPKFRSMVVDAEEKKASLLKNSIHGGHPTFKMKNDPRLTWIGWYLRKMSIDEMPQLWSVLRGEMSLVGPRPPLPSEVAVYGPYELKRLEAKPGLTCLWQISGRSDLAFPEQVHLDRKYIESQTLWLDCKILLQTIPAVLIGKGAY